MFTAESEYFMLQNCETSQVRWNLFDEDMKEESGLLGWEGHLVGWLVARIRVMGKELSTPLNRSAWQLSARKLHHIVYLCYVIASAEVGERILQKINQKIRIDWEKLIFLLTKPDMKVVYDFQCAHQPAGCFLFCIPNKLCLLSDRVTGFPLQPLRLKWNIQLCDLFINNILSLFILKYADSFNFNPHKWLLINFDCSAMWWVVQNISHVLTLLLWAAIF